MSDALLEENLGHISSNIQYSVWSVGGGGGGLGMVEGFSVWHIYPLPHVWHVRFLWYNHFLISLVARFSDASKLHFGKGSLPLQTRLYGSVPPLAWYGRTGLGPLLLWTTYKLLMTSLKQKTRMYISSPPPHLLVQQSNSMKSMNTLPEWLSFELGSISTSSKQKLNMISCLFLTTW